MRIIFLMIQLPMRALHLLTAEEGCSARFVGWRTQGDGWGWGRMVGCGYVWLFVFGVCDRASFSGLAGGGWVVGFVFDGVVRVCAYGSAFHGRSARVFGSTGGVMISRDGSG